MSIVADRESVADLQLHNLALDITGDSDLVKTLTF